MKNAIIVLLILVVVGLFVALTRQAHRNNDLRRWNEALKARATARDMKSLDDIQGGFPPPVTNGPQKADDR